MLPMNRRVFLSVGVPALLRGLTSSEPRITEVRFAPIEGRFHKFVAMNSYDRAPKGHTYTGTLVRIATSAGVEGIGTTGYRTPDASMLAAAKTLIGASVRDIYELTQERVTGYSARFREALHTQRNFDGPLFDLLGKVVHKPAWQLMGDSARDGVEVYDGTLYFSDIWFRDRGVRAVVEEAEEAVRKGYRGLKLKLGRGSRWMDRDAGLQRDIEVVVAVRAAVGPNVRLMADANNGYRDDFERAWQLMERTADARLFWMEEIFPENVVPYGRLRDRMERAKKRAPLRCRTTGVRKLAG